MLDEPLQRFILQILGALSDICQEVTGVPNYVLWAENLVNLL